MQSSKLTKHRNESVDDQSNNQQHLPQRSPELGLAVPFHGHHIDESIEHHNNRYHRSGRNSITPKVDDNVASCHFKRHQDCLEDEEVPAGLPQAVSIWGVWAHRADHLSTHSESKRLISISPSKSDERRRDGQVSDHLSHAQSHCEDHTTPHRESDEQTSRSTIEKTASNLNVQSRSNCTANPTNTLAIFSFTTIHAKRSTNPISWICLAFNFRCVLSWTPDKLTASEPCLSVSCSYDGRSGSALLPARCFSSMSLALLRR
jgi:hypothetical protein